uniref:Uncharacterized protein n=1 Tax=Anguilla anguilla TaxID=7936 RepID=A0A0E9XR63_ANGAN
MMKYTEEEEVNEIEAPGSTYLQRALQILSKRSEAKLVKQKP